MTEIQPIQTEDQLLLNSPKETSLERLTRSRLPVIFPRSNRSLLVISSFGAIFALGAIFTFSYFNGITQQEASAKAQQASAAAAVAALPNAYAGVQLLSASAYVYDLTTHQVLFTLNPDAVRPLASLTKIAMALAVSEVLPLDSSITIPYDTAAAGSAEVLTRGSLWPVHDVLSFTLIASSNQGADILSAAANDAIHAKYPQSPAGEPNAATLWRMNDIARGLGLTSMHFENDNGLDITSTQSGAYGSARDVGALVAYADSTALPVFAGTTQDVMTFTNASGDKATAYNTDTALAAIPGIIMGKTGYTDLAGGNLAIAFDAGLGHPVVAVVLGSTEDGRFSDMKQLITATEAAVAQGQ
jgi:D-alanyl-D-alanine endopeptidase (penicillin-binding protein 7)